MEFCLSFSQRKWRESPRAAKNAILVCGSAKALPLFTIDFSHLCHQTQKLLKKVFGGNLIGWFDYFTNKLRRACHSHGTAVGIPHLSKITVSIVQLPLLCLVP
jgi:hypothetical protein